MSKNNLSPIHKKRLPRYEYRALRQTCLNSGDEVCRYGILATTGRGALTFLPDVTHSLSVATEIAERLNREQLDPIHLGDAVSDLLSEIKA